MGKAHTELVNVCLKWLKLKRIMAWANNTGTTVIERRLVKFGKPGSSDIFAVSRGRFIAIECKVGRDRLRPTQIIFAADVVLAGGLAFTVRSLEDLQEALGYA